MHETRAMSAEGSTNAILSDYALLSDEPHTALSTEQQVIALFEQLRTAVFRHVLLILMNAPASEDVTQEAFLRLHVALSGDMRIKDMKAWVFRVAHNLALDQLRTRKPSSSLSDDVVLLQAEQKSMRGTRTPEQLYLTTERTAQIQSAIAQLSPRQRQCLSLKSEGLAYQEIASILGVRRSTVIENIRRATARLAGELQF